MNKIMIIGIDGVSYSVIDRLSNEGFMPNFNKLKKEGIFKKIESSIPEISSVSWSSIITGENPGEHGIYGFTDMIDKTYTLRFPNFKDLKNKPFWKTDDKKYLILNVPSTYPAQELNGVLVSGFVSLDLERAVYPENILENLKQFDYKIDVDSQKAHISTDLFLSDLFDTLEKRKKFFNYIIKKENWDVIMTVFTGTDRLGHFLFNAYEDEKNKYHKKFLEFFKKVDEGIGDLIKDLGEDDSIIIVSDHGMQLIDKNVYLNTFLKQENLLKTAKTEKEEKYTNILPETKAFVLDPGRVYLNKKGKYPNGSVEKDEEEHLIKQLIDLFENFEFEGKKIIKKIYRSNEIYKGPYAEKAPDLILIPNKGFNLRGSMSKDKIFEEDIFTGMHTQDDAFLLLKTKKNIELPEEANVKNTFSIIQRLK